MTNNQNDIYITGVLYQQSAFPDSATSVFDELDTAFRTISGIYYENFCVNRSECRFSDGSTREQLLVFLKNVKLDGATFFTDTQSTSLRNSLLSIINGLSDFTFTDIEMRTTREIS